MKKIEQSNIKLFSVRDAADVLDIGQDHVYELVNKGKLVMEGGMITRDSIARYALSEGDRR